MTPEQKQITIAEWEGWDKKSDFQPEQIHCLKAIWIEAENRGFFIPSYLTSRDAICGAVARLDEWRRLVFAYRLDALLRKDRQPYFEQNEPLCCAEWTASEVMSILLATPAQMADALLLTLGHKL